MANPRQSLRKGLDQAGDGKVDRDTLVDFLQKLDPNLGSNTGSILNPLTVDSDGRISIDEFLDAIYGPDQTVGCDAPAPDSELPPGIKESFAGVMVPSSAKAPIILVNGPPCAGKGVLCKRLAKASGLVHVSVGDICRAYAKEATDVGKAINSYLQRGDFVPDELMIHVVMDKLTQRDVVEHGALLDGFPRTPTQASLFLEHAQVHLFLLLQADDGVVKERASGRLQDPETGEIYHKDLMPPPAGLAAKLTYRQGDRDEAAISKRLEVFRKNIESITPQFGDKLQVIDGHMPADEVFASIGRFIQASTEVSIDFTGGVKDEDEWSDDEVAAESDEAKLGLAVAPSCDVGTSGGDHLVAINITCPDIADAQEDDTTGRVAVDICCLIDISGSMATEATYEDEFENRKSDGLTYLDVVKHAVKTVIHMLGENDRLALVAFDDRSDVVFEPGFMTEEGRKRALNQLEMLAPRGRTNIWKGLSTAMDALRGCDAVSGSRPRTILLLTDGVPNEVPPKGHIAEFRDYKECHPNFDCSVNTFGFGYALDSQLLLDLAAEGQGTFGFIPDALLVGTCFVNSIATMLSMQSQKVTVHLKATGGAEFSGPVLGVDEQMVTDASWGRVVNLGTFQIGSSREIVVPLKIPPGDAPYLEAVVAYTGANGKQCQVTQQSSDRQASEFAAIAAARSSTVQQAYDCIRECSTASQNKYGQDLMSQHAQKLQDFEQVGKEWVTNLIGDVNGRVSKSLQGDDRFNRWGKHYLRAFARAHQVQQCTNFMDKSLQEYGGRLFRGLRSIGDKVFISLPPPQPSIRYRAASTIRSSTSAAPAAAAPDMTVYYGGSGGG